jgi:oxygen-independent coproporphyrinogen III oxidase
MTTPTDPVDLDLIMAGVGPALRVQYNKPHVYPMAAPLFVPCPGVERERPPRGPLDLYVHIPFCSYKCTFCTYATRQGSGPDQMQRYVRALKRELEWVEPGTLLTYLYIGGGTPTALAPELLEEVLAAVWERLQSPGAVVHTVECSPETITPAHIQVLRRRGIERVSMGIQTLDAEVLHSLNRRHSREDALSACDLLADSGLMVNIDLIYGLPRQTETSFHRDFQTVAARGVHSVSVYNLHINERTPVSAALDEDERLGLKRLVHWRALVRAVAAELGFTQSRWHTFVRQGGRADTSHPAARFEDVTSIGNVFGIGMSARSRLLSTVYRNHPDLTTYFHRIEAGQSPVEEVFSLREEDHKTLFISQCLGSGKPLDRQAYERSFGCSFEQDFGPVLPRLRASGLIDESAGVIALTPTGRLVFDLVTWMFYPQRAREWIAERQTVELRTRKKSSPTNKPGQAA